MALNIPKKEDKLSSQVRDAIRILAWQQYKLDSQCSGLEAYEEFNTEWKAHEIHGFDNKRLNKFVTELGYSLNELAQIRKEYYAARNGNSSSTLQELGTSEAPSF